MTPLAKSETRLSPLALKILAVLDHGEWLDQEDLIEQVQYSVSPGEAYRYAQDTSRADSRTRDMDDMIAAGRRAKTITVLNSMIGTGRVEREGEPGRGKPKKVRLAKRVSHVYVVRDKNDDLHVYSQGTPGVAVHVIDAWAKSMDPAQDSKTLVEVLEGVPASFPNREKVEKALRGLINRLNVDATVKSMSTWDTPIDVIDDGTKGFIPADHEPSPGGDEA